MAEPVLTADALEALLLAAPVHLLYFDRDLRCRYAAPYGPHFLGQSVQALLGTSAQTIFPPTMPIVRRLEQVLASQTTWWGEQLPYPAGPNASWPAGRWNVHMQPWSLTSEAAAPAVSTQESGKQPQQDGVLLGCLPCDGAVDTTAEGQRSAVLLEGMRTQLTVIGGYASLLQRRPQPESVVVPSARIAAAVQQLTRLLEEYERATQLPVQHPDLRTP